MTTAVESPVASLDHYLTLSQVASMLQISERGVRNLVTRGSIPQPVRVGKLIRWSERKVREFLENPSKQVDAVGTSCPA